MLLMNMVPAHRLSRLNRFVLTVFVLATLQFAHQVTFARPPYRSNFFTAYPTAVGTVLDTVPSHSSHCGVCHYDFNGGGQRNPYGSAVEATDRSVASILGLGGLESDGDSYVNSVEITDVVSYTNTPTFPGLTPANVSQVLNVSVADIQNHLTPLSAGDTTPPTVSVTSPNGGEILTANTATTVQWSATDASGVAGVNIYLSLDGGATYDLIASGLSNSGSFVWFPANRPTIQAVIRVEAVDNASNYGADTSSAVFTIVSPPGGRVPTTLRDFDQPGSQPFEAGVLNSPADCAACHGNYNPAVQPYFNWQGSMMAQASRDPLFEACLAVANQDAPDSGDLCLRCHISRGWLQGRSVPTNGNQMLASDKFGVSCDSCHRLVDPIAAAENPTEDTAILAGLSNPPTEFGNGMYVIDPTGARRGPFTNASSGHPVLVSPFHREAALCGTCHDVSNPAFERNGNGDYVPNAFNAAATGFSAHSLGPVERTYSEWLNSAYNTPAGVYAPQFGGNRDYVASCQDCHMRDVTGQACNTNPPVRTDLPLHDMTGGSTWLPGLLATLFPGDVDPVALQAGVERARYMLQNAATLTTLQIGRNLRVTVANETGHKLPTGYPEGRRMWLNVKFYDASQVLIAESGAYDLNTGVLTHDPAAKIYEIEPVTAGIPGLPDGSAFHFVLNSVVMKDNRIPPRGFTNAAYSAFGGSPVGATYADGQYWDNTIYDIPPTAASVVATLYYQSTSKEYVEFLRDEVATNTTGQQLYDLWANNGMCPPEMMAQAERAITPPLVGDFNDDGYTDIDEFAHLTDCLMGPDVAYATGCAPGDADSDNDVDMSDLAAFQLAFTGPDVMPPAAPTGLAALGELHAVSLEWNDNAEPDLAGYNVYRAGSSGGSYIRLNATLLTSSSFLDTTVVDSVTYFYVVTAEDTHGNESAASGEASATPYGNSTMHVAAIVLSVDDQGGGQKYGVATVTIQDHLGAPVSNATVTGTFAGDFAGTRSGATNGSGVVTLTIGPRSGHTNFTFCVDSVTYATVTYDAGQNIETCAAYP